MILSSMILSRPSFRTFRERSGLKDLELNGVVSG